MTIEELTLLVEKLQARIDFLERENAELRLKLGEMSHKKNSSNSSMAPSKDENRYKKNQSLREKGEKKNGGQQGHKGSTLEFSATPDETISHIPEICSNCKSELDSEAILVDQRQNIDIPPIRSIITQHDYYERSCMCCGHVNTLGADDLPKSRVYYGSRIEALIGYLSVRQYLSVNRIAELLEQVFDVRMSEGTIMNKIANLASKCQGEYDQIIKDLFEGSWVGSDETSYRMNGKKHWMWTWQNDDFTYLFASENRGSATITSALDSIKTNKSVLVHDCYSSHFSIDSKTHQICIAHLLRELKYLVEKRNSQWPRRFRKVLLKALEIHREGMQSARQKVIGKLKRIINTLIDAPMESNKGVEYKNFRKRMVKYRNYILTFLNHQHVPPDNNGSERAIRNVKVKLKVSGQFKTHKGSEYFAMIRSVIDTAIKQNQDPLHKLMSLS
jgi:transposase